MIEEGTNLFEGLPCPTREVYNLLGEVGINAIREKIKKVLEHKKETIEDDDDKPYGLANLLLFKDLQSDIIYKVGLTLQDILKKPALNYRLMKKWDHELYQTKIKTHIPELLIPEKYKANNYQLLNQTDHYLIRKFIEDDRGAFDKNISDI